MPPAAPHLLQDLVLVLNLGHYLAKQLGLLLAAEGTERWLEARLETPHSHRCPGQLPHLYSDEASWAAMGTSLAKMSGPVTAGSVGFTGKGFTKGAPGGEKLWTPGP